MSSELFKQSRSVTRSDDALQHNLDAFQVAGRIWREHLRPRLSLVISASIAMMVSAATTGAVPVLIKTATDEVFTSRSQAMVLTISLAVLVVTLFKALSEYVGRIAIQYLGHRFIADLRMQMFERLTYADIDWIEKVHSGRFLASFLNDAALIRQTASRTMLAFGENLTKVIVLTGVMFYMDWRLASLIMICLPAGILLMGRQRKKMRKSTKKSMQETGDLSALISQTLRGIRVVKAYGQERREVTRAHDVIERALEFTMRGARAQALSSPAVEILAGIGFAAAIYFAGQRGMTGEMTLGHFFGFMGATMLIYQPLKSLATLQTAIQEGVAASSRVFGIIDRQRQLTETRDAPKLNVSSGKIEFEHVRFGYEPDKPVLQDFSLVVPAGKTVALVGPSGAGKSSVLALLLRFFDPQQGRILIDGQDITGVDLTSLRRSMALVTQDPVLFDDTIRNNIGYGIPDAGPDAIIRAAQAAAADEFISRLPDGYDTLAGEAGNNLSGGERQRVAIARAILLDAPILLLDEPTSALDARSEEKVQVALQHLMKDRTVLMIAHRLSTVKNADLIVVMDHGRIVEQGTHDELMTGRGLYAQLHQAQYMPDTGPETGTSSSGATE